MAGAAPAPSPQMPKALRGFAWGALPVDAPDEMVRIFGAHGAALLALKAMAVSMSGLANKDNPRLKPWRPTRQEVADFLQVTPVGADKVFAQIAACKVGTDGAAAGVFSVAKDEKTHTYSFEVVDLDRVKRLRETLKSVPSYGRKEMPKGEARIEKRRERVQALLAEMICPSCGSHTMDLRCRACGHETELTEVYVTERMTVTNTAPAGTEVLPAPDDSDPGIPVSTASAEARLAETPVSTQCAHEVPAKHNNVSSRVTSEIKASGEASGNGNSETPVFVAALKAALALHWLRTFGKALDWKMAGLIAAALQHEELIEDFLERFLAVDPELWNRPGRRPVGREEGGHDSGFAVVLAEQARLTFEERGAIAATGPPGRRGYQELKEALGKAQGNEVLPAARRVMAHPLCTADDRAILLELYPALAEAPDADKV